MEKDDMQLKDRAAPLEKSLVREQRIIAVGEDTFGPSKVHVCIEDTVTIRLNDEPVAALKVTPADLDSFAIGFLVCEGLIPDPSYITHVRIDPPLISVEADIDHCEEYGHSLEVRSAGIGVSQPDGIQGSPVGTGIFIDKETIFEGTRQVHEAASIWRETGGTHCTILVDAEGHILSAAEDIGRHTSVDKAVGKAIRSGTNPSNCFMVCTGRLPADMVAKAYRAGISIVVSNNAPFSSGISLANRMNMTLIGFARPPRMSIYTHPERIRL